MVTLLRDHAPATGENMVTQQRDHATPLRVTPYMRLAVLLASAGRRGYPLGLEIRNSAAARRAFRACCPIM